MIYQDKLKAILKYDFESGLFFWIETASTKIKVGDIAGCRNGFGHLDIKIDGKTYKAHRLAWLYMNGVWPKEIDHINHIEYDNRWVNLREVSHAENLRNSSKYKSNTSGFTGVRWHKATKKWAAEIRVNQKAIHLGLYSDINDAIDARKEANFKHGFHKNHGQQAEKE